MIVERWSCRSRLIVVHNANLDLAESQLRNRLTLLSWLDSRRFDLIIFLRVVFIISVRRTTEIVIIFNI